MNIRIIEDVIEVFHQYGDTIRFDYERFEEALNDQAPDLLDECYLVVLGMKIGIFDAMIFDENIDFRGYVDYLVEAVELSERDAVFMVSIFDILVKEVGYYFEIPNMDELLKESYQRNDFDHLMVIAKTYFMGFGVLQDYEKAFQIYSYLFSQGDERGAYYLGYMYEHGYGIEKDIEKAIMYYQSHQDDLTDFRLGVFYMLGQYVEKDEEKALEYLTLSHEAESYLYQGMLLEKRREYADAFQAYYQGAKLFQRECMYKAALFLKLGFGVDLDLNEAYRYFEYGYFLLHGESAYELSMMYFDGLVVDKDVQKALTYLHQAASLYSQEACLALAQFYDLGRYVQKNHQKAIQYYQKANEIQDAKG